MPVTDHDDFESLPLEAFRLVRGVPLHDVFMVDLEGDRECTIPLLLDLIEGHRSTALPWDVRALFAIRRGLGKALGWDRPRPASAIPSPLDDVPADLARTSLVPPGTRAGPFRALYLRPDQAVYAARNATVDARLMVAIVRSDTGHRLYWASYVRPVGRITTLYMHAIDPFRRRLVYPGLERWLVRTWRASNGAEVGSP